MIADVYLKADIKADIERVEQLLKAEPLVGNVEFISKEQAYRTERKRKAKASELLGSNPLPDTFPVTPVKPDDIAKLKEHASAQARAAAPPSSIPRSTRCATARRTRTRSSRSRAS